MKISLDNTPPAELGYPKGWLIKANKYLNIPNTEHNAAAGLFEHVFENNNSVQGSRGLTGYRDIAYGNYDRIQILPVDSLSYFTREANQAHNWFGSSQSILLYTWKDKQEGRCFKWKKDCGATFPKIVAVDPQYGEREDDFFAVSFCYISDGMRSSSRGLTYRETLDMCNEQIKQLVDAFNMQLQENGETSLHNRVLVEVFGSLSAAEIVILWSAKQYTDIMYLIDCIRDFEYTLNDNRTLSVFRTTYTMITFPDAVRKGRVGSWEEMIDPNLSSILGQSYVQFATQDGAGEGSFAEFEAFFYKCMENASLLIGESTGTLKSYPVLQRCAGEYDLIANVESKYLTRLFSNPMNWHERNWQFNREKLQKDTLELKDCTCSVHHPLFNRYILYSFTRLSYKRDDLPVFAQGITEKWEKIRREISCIHATNITEVHPNNRMALIKGIRIALNGKESDQEKFDKLLTTVRTHIPLASNLCAELNLLFSDYMQCLCASADMLWIEDYRELFRQILDLIDMLISNIEVWDQYGIGLVDRNAWEDARWYMDIIEGLIRALHKQTSHISTSNKLFFREQETHFGYTAQHDLVLHAYYDIIKHLMEYIYHYTDTSIQSALYPLVNFQPDNRVNSVIYAEERARLYLKYRKLHPRIMVIHIPLDGMDNLMHYLPMLIHEVYHYAAPRDRERRNRILAKIAVYQTLRYSFSLHFQSLLTECATGNQEIDPQELDPEHELERRFHNLLDPITFDFIEKHEANIYNGLKEYFFVYEQENLTQKELEELKQVSILRNWFVLWLENWFNDENAREGKRKKSDVPGDRYENYSDLFEDFFSVIIDTLKLEVERTQAVAEEEYSVRHTVYCAAIEKMKVQIQAALIGSDQANEDTSSIVQSIAAKSQEYVHSEEYQRLLKRVDEIFPDIAMVTLLRMPASGYMLQTALDLDKQLCYCEDNVIDYIRIGAIFGWLLSNQTTDKKNVRKCLEDELSQFESLYIASYSMAASAAGGTDIRRKDRAETWSSAFRNIYHAYEGEQGIASLNHVRTWIWELIEDQMIPCLELTGDLEAERKELFEKSYHTYLNILKTAQEEGPNQSELFDLSIQTILQFQRYLPLKTLNADFQAKVKSEIGKGKSTEIAGFALAPYESVALSPDHYFSMIRAALYRLYQYRDQEGLSTVTGMWYRGSSNAAHPILPSGFVHFAEDVGLLKGVFDLNKPYPYMEVQRHHYEAFRYSAEGSSPDITPAQYQCTLDYLTLMQHYSQHTSLLDWSEDFFASTYFALEDEVNLNDKYPYEREGKVKDDHLKDRDADAALYILDPLRFNRACEEIEEELNDLFSVSRLFEEGRIHIPNLSIKENQDWLTEYHNLYSLQNKTGVIILTQPTGADPEKLPNITLSLMKQYSQIGTKLMIHLPRAVYAAKLNSRIRAQSGLFVAFSLLSAPAVWKDVAVKTDCINAGLFSYQALEQIQDYYLSLPHKHPFLMKIVIPSSMKEGLGKQFYHFGLSKERIYPELQNHRYR